MHLRQNRILHWVAMAVVALGIIAALPAFKIWLGLPPEGDAVDYRVPWIKWLFRHGTYPNWPWSYVDDYPSLGDLLMAGLYGIDKHLMRLVPLGAYVGLAYFGGKIYAILFPEQDSERARALTWTAAAWIIGLRPLTMQANLLMVDNLASCFLLGSLYFILARRYRVAGLVAAMAVATRYTAWSGAAALGLALLFSEWKKNRKFAWREFAAFSAITLLGAAPFIIRNWVVNHNPVFPIATTIFNGYDINYFAAYGRGTSLTDLLLLPYDMLYTTNFVKNYYDYTLGKLFFIQLGAVFWIALTLTGTQLRAKIANIRTNSTLLTAAMFLILYTLGWFYGSQQMRFLVPALVLLNLGMLRFCTVVSKNYPIIFLTALSLLSVYSIQNYSWKMAFGETHSFIERARTYTAHCFHASGITKESLVAHLSRDSALGFFDHDFIYGGTHPYALAQYREYYKDYADFAYDPVKLSKVHENFIRWPSEHPCVLKRIKDN